MVIAHFGLAIVTLGIVTDSTWKLEAAVLLKPGQSIETFDYKAAIFAATGARFECNVIGVAPWNAGFGWR